FGGAGGGGLNEAVLGEKLHHQAGHGHRRAGEDEGDGARHAGDLEHLTAVGGTGDVVDAGEEREDEQSGDDEDADEQLDVEQPPGGGAGRRSGGGDGHHGRRGTGGGTPKDAAAERSVLRVLEGVGEVVEELRVGLDALVGVGVGRHVHDLLVLDGVDRGERLGADEDLGGLLVVRVVGGDGGVAV